MRKYSGIKCTSKQLGHGLTTSARWLALAAAASGLLVSGCASAPSSLTTPVDKPGFPAHWSAPLPDTQRHTIDITNWWRAQSQPELADLIEAAQRVSPTVAAARSRIAQAQAAQVQARSALVPQISAAVSATSTRSPVQDPALRQAQAGLQFNWELNLATLQGVDAQAAQAQRDAADLQWHDARILVAAEVAIVYHGLRSSQRQAELLAQDVASLDETVRYTQMAVRAGQSAQPALSVALIDAAEGRNRLQQQQAASEVQVKALVALTGMSESALKDLLATRPNHGYEPRPFAVEAIPARILAQRPDVLAAERQVLLAQAQLLQADANRLPRLSLQGLVGPGRTWTGSIGGSGPTWTIGPLALTLPVFDGGARVAQHSAARGAVDSALSSYHAQVRQAVREVEEALVQLRAAEHRWQNGQQAAEQAQQMEAANLRLMKTGLLSGMAFEAAQRQSRAADLTALTLDLERQRSWVTLYRAVGGGFQATEPKH